MKIIEINDDNLKMVPLLKFINSSKHSQHPSALFYVLFGYFACKYHFNLANISNNRRFLPYSQEYPCESMQVLLTNNKNYQLARKFYCTIVGDI
jgi:hypothetical protein